MSSLFLVMLSIPAWAANPPLTKTSSCTAVNFAGDAWQHIARQEPRLLEHLEYIAKQAGGVVGTEVKMTNCHVTTPVNSYGEETVGDRVVVMDKVWETNINGQWQKHIAGMKVVYSEKVRTLVPEKRWVLTPEGYYREETFYTEALGRRVQGLSICAGQSCFELQIPFASTSGGVTGPAEGTSLGASTGIGKDATDEDASVTLRLR